MGTEPRRWRTWCPRRKLLRLDQITSVAIPSVDQEAARDLVRAREDCRGDLMRARHRLSKLLLRHGIVYYGGAAWTGRHDTWLRHEASAQLSARRQGTIYVVSAAPKVITVPVGAAAGRVARLRVVADEASTAVGIGVPCCSGKELLGSADVGVVNCSQELVAARRGLCSDEERAVVGDRPDSIYVRFGTWRV